MNVDDILNINTKPQANAWDLYDKKDYKGCLDILLKEMANNQLLEKSYIILGHIYSKGLYLKPDLSKAEEYYNMGSYPEKYYYLGEMFYDKNNKKSFEYYKKSKYYPLSFYKRGEMYFYGKGIEIDKIKAMNEFIMGATIGDPNCKKIVDKYKLETNRNNEEFNASSEL